MKKNASSIRTTTGTFTTLALALCLAGLANSAHAQQLPAGVCTVTPDGTPTGTWLSPKKLEAALADASCSVLWLMQGTYTQTVSAEGFLIDRNLQLYGGFTGDETAFASRPPTVDNSLTKLDGEAKRRVLRIDGTTTNGPITNATVIDGVSIQNGKAQAAAGTRPRGGGIYCNGTHRGNECSPSINNATFSSNVADLGGAIYNDSASSGLSSPSITNSLFSGNSASYGGALYVWGETSSSRTSIANSTFSGNSSSYYGGALYDAGPNRTSITNSTFSGNSAKRGGALYVENNYGISSPSIINSTFSSNSAESGGALYIVNYADVSIPTIINSTFSSNSAESGGAMWFVGDPSGLSLPTIRASIIWGNTTDVGPQIYNFNVVPKISYSIVQDSGGSTNWDDLLGANDSGNLDADPLLDPLADNGGPTPTMMPGVGSAAIDPLVSTTFCPATDQRGVARPTGPAAKCHIGAVHVRSGRYDLTVKVEGAGSVTAAPGVPTNGSGNLENCAANSPCTATYFGENDPSSVLLKAVTPPGGSIFSGWSGDACNGSTSPTCSITMDASKSVTATFAPFTLPPTILSDGIYGIPYSSTLLSAVGGVAPIIYTEPDDKLPPGLDLGLVNRELSGEPNKVGSYTFTVTASDDNGATATQTYTLEVTAAAPSSVDVSTSTAGIVYGSTALLSTGLDLTGPGSGLLDVIKVEDASFRACTTSVDGNRYAGYVGCEVPGLSAGTHTFKARFTPGTSETNVLGGTSSAITVTVAQASQTISNVASSPSALVYAPNATFAVSANGGGSTSPVVFTSNSPNVCTVNGSTVTMLKADECTLVATQAGDANHTAAAPLSQTFALGKGTQVIQFTSTPPAGAKVGQSYTVSASGGQSGNSVTFAIDAATQANCSVSGNTVTLNTKGVCRILADQKGDANFTAATQAPQEVKIDQGASGVNIASTPNPSKSGQTVTFTVSVALDSTKSTGQRLKAIAEPTGTVEITDNGKSIGSAPLVNGVATIAVSLDSVGEHSIVASYSGDANYPATASVPFTQTVAEAAVTPVATPVPTLNEWALIGLTALLGLFGASRMRRRSA